MKLETPRNVEIFDAVKINDIQRIYEIGPGSSDKEVIEGSIITPNYRRLIEIERKMAIIVPIKGESLNLLEGILASIPLECLVIILSNSDRRRIDQYKMEVDTIENFCHISKHNAIAIHQKDRDLALTLKEAEYSTILSSGGLVRNGKGEAMVIGMMIAKIFKKEYVGFIDADNFVPSTAYEYIQSFAAGFSITKTPYSMVRVSWRFKPKISNGGLYFRRRGRVSEITNRILNLIISDFTGFGSQIIKTGNAGEHAISLKLAELLQFASGFAIEPYEIVNLLEKFGKSSESEGLKAINDRVEVLQIESRSPHFHDAKGESHLNKMLLEGLSSIFHSNICSNKVKQEIINDLKSKKIISSRKKIPKPNIMEPIAIMNFEKFRSEILMNKNTLHFFNINPNLLITHT